MNELAIHVEFERHLQAVWADVLSCGQPELVVLEGAAGLGKTHLAAGLRRSVMRDAAVRGLVAVPGALIATVLRALPGLSGRREAAFVSAARVHLPHDAWPSLIPRDGSAAGGGTDALAELSRAAAQEVTAAHPLILVAEDLHEQDALSRAFLEALWARLLLDARPALLVVTTRPLAEYPDAAAGLEALERTSQLTRGRSVTHLTLTPMTRDSAQTLIRVHLGEYPPPELADWLHTHAEGHPLRSVELLHVLRDRGVLTHHGHHWHFQPPPQGSMPQSLSAVLLARLQAVQLQTAPWQALTALAVLDGPAPERAWRQVAALGTEVFAAAREWLLHRGLVRLHAGGPEAGTQYICGHPLYAPLLRGELDWPELQALHARAARSDLDVLARARHARQAGAADATLLTVQAMRLAAQRGAHQDVIREARALLGDGALLDDRALPEETPAELEAREALVAALNLTGQWETIMQETDVAEPESLSVPLLTSRALALSSLARLPEAVKLARLGLGRIELGGTAPGAAHQLSLEDTLYRALIHQGELGVAETELNDLLHSSPPLRPIRRMQCLDLLSEVSHRRGNYHLCMQLAREAVRLAEQDEGGPDLHAAQHWRVLNKAGSSAIHLSLWAEAESYLRAAQEIVLRHALVFCLMIVEGNLAYLHLMRGEYPEAEAGSWRQYERAVTTRHVRVQSALLWNIAICRLWRGDAVQAHDLMRRSLELWPSVGAANASDFAEALALMGRSDEARAELARPDHDYYMEHPNSRARVHLCLGEATEALCEAARIQPEDGGGLRARSALIQAQAYALLGDLTAASEAVNTALNSALAAQHRSVEGEALLTAAVLTWRSDKRAQATFHWAQGMELLQATDGQGHLLFVSRLFPSEAAALRDAPGPVKAVRRARLRLLGNLGLEDETGRLRPWKARKVKELLGLLVCAYYSGAERGLARERLILELWPDADETGAEASFRKTVTRLREALGNAAYLERTPAGYALTDVNADLNDFLDALNAGRAAQAAAAYTAPFLNDLDLPEAHDLREALHACWRRVLLGLAQADPQGAQPHLNVLLAHDPLDVQVTLALLHTYVALGETASHTALLRRARTVYQTTLGEVPEELTETP